MLAGRERPRDRHRAEVSASAALRLAAQAEQAIERADGKASALAATATAILLFAAQAVPLRGAAHPAGLAVAALATGAACWAAGIVALAAAIFPRLTGRAEAGAWWPERAPRRFDSAQMDALIRRMAADPRRWQLAQAHALGRIALKKYRYIRLGMLLLGLGAAVGVCGELLL